MNEIFLDHHLNSTKGKGRKKAHVGTGFKKMCNALQRDARHMWEWISKGGKCTSEDTCE
jgi:hypothetical protein